MAPHRTRITDEQTEDQSFITEREFNDFFADVVVTGTTGIDDTELQTTFDNYFPGRGLITAGSGIIVTTGTNFVEITNSAAGGILPGSGITLEEHEEIDSLVHSLAETSTTEITRNGSGQVTNVDVRTVPATGTLIRSTAITRDLFGRVTVVVENQHDETGTIIQTLTSTINRSGGIVTSVDTVET